MDSFSRYNPGSVKHRLTLALGRELHEGERVVWQNMQLARIELASFAIYLFAIPWTAFSLFWVTMAAAGVGVLDENGSMNWLGLAFPMFGIPFVLVGLGMMSAPFLPLFQRGRILYAVTTKRALKLSLGRSLSVESVPANRVGKLERIESRDGTGTVLVAAKIGRDSDGDARTEHFKIGRVRDVMGAFTALEKLGEDAARP